MSAGVHHLNADPLESQEAALPPPPQQNQHESARLEVQFDLRVLGTKTHSRVHRVHVKPTVSHHVRPRGLIDEVSRDWG